MTFGRKVLYSLWVLGSVLGLGCLSGLGLLVIGLRARRPAWWASGLGYLLATWAVFIVFERTREDASAGYTAVLFFLLWLASIVHSLAVNPGWLRWVASRQPVRPLSPPPVFTPPPVPGAGPASPSFPPPPVPGAGPASPFAPPPGAGPASPFVPPGVGPASSFLPPGVGPTPPAPAHVPPSAAPVFGPIDLNAATAAQLAGFGEFDLARAEQIVAERTARGGFSSVEEFATVAQLAPHQLARLRPQVRCGPRPDAPPAGGRILDF
ncbi:helix-hairpin-helix domain-containing protein [Dactylosporangium sp. NPDC005572]|uniref:ComEA family DNA-binding protein n=1 Tax=Dactylosporangium sp. NPDC005572 TaxID=3156889 RepID=UPI0033A2E7A1